MRKIAADSCLQPGERDALHWQSWQSDRQQDAIYYSAGLHTCTHTLCTLLGCMQCSCVHLNTQQKSSITHSITSALSADAAVIQPAGAPWQQRRRRGKDGDDSGEMRGSPPWFSCFPICVHSYTYTHRHTHTHKHRDLCRIRQSPVAAFTSWQGLADAGSHSVATRRRGEQKGGEGGRIGERRMKDVEREA